MSEQSLKCRICNNSDENKSFVAREMMFGTKKEFEYFECTTCKCVQIKNIPEDLEKYYPEKYNSFDKIKKTKDGFIKRYLKTIFSKHLLEENKNIIGKYLLKKFDPAFLLKIQGTKVNLNSKILDVGSGSGSRLISLTRYGFKNITGIDPFIEEDIYYDNGVKIFKNNIYHFEGLFDMVMLNHSFEHMLDPDKVLNEINRLLKLGAVSLIRIPIADSYAWKTYGINWMALDPPRHLHLHTKESIKILAKNSGFALIDILYDSNAYQFWGSEQYSKDIPLRDSRSHYENPNNSIFSKDDIIRFKNEADDLNKREEGDAACFYLKKISDVT